MLKRKMYNKLATWHQSKEHTAFLLVGARQTGKTYIIRQFAREQFANVIEINFLDNKDAAGILQDARNTEDFLSRLTLLTQTPATPGQTLIFFDEVQEAPDLITVIKFLVEDGRYAVVLSGSMLGTELKGFRSFPVGYVRIARMFPLDFEEFCWAQGITTALIDDIREAYHARMALDESLHQRLINLYRYYVAIGGMPQVVQTYLDASYDMGAVRATATQIVEQYRFDIAKYAEKRAPQIRSVYDAIPSQLNKENKRFRMDAIKNGAKFNRYEDDFAWLIDAAVALPVYTVSEPKLPLKRTAQPNKFKLYASDTGLLIAQYLPKIMLDVITNAKEINFGAVYENAVAQALACQNPNLYYFYQSRKGEVDFIVERNNGSILPIEVKSGKDYKLHTALNNLLSTEDYDIHEAYVLSMANISLSEKAGKSLWYLPLYMSFCIAEETNGSLEGVRIAPPSFDNLA